MYYVYRHIRLDKNEVFYIGIGTINYLHKTHKSMYYRAYEKKKSRSGHWKNIIAITKYDIEIIFESCDIDLIRDKEIEFIKLYKNTLCNQTKGGLGIESYNHKDITKRKISDSTRGVSKSKEHRDNINRAKLKSIIMYKDELEISFNSIKECAIYLGNKNYQHNIAAVAKGRRATAYGYKFKYNENADSKDKEP